MITGFRGRSSGCERVLNSRRYGQVLSALNNSVSFQSAQFICERSTVNPCQGPVEFTKPFSATEKEANDLHLPFSADNGQAGTNSDSPNSHEQPLTSFFSLKISRGAAFVPNLRRTIRLGSHRLRTPDTISCSFQLPSAMDNEDYAPST